MFKLSKSRPNAPLGATLVVLSSFFYASYGIWTKLMGDFFGGYTASGLRSILVLILLLPFALYYKQLKPIAWRKDWKYLVGLVVPSFFIWGPLYYAILHAGIGISLALNYASIVIGMFIFGWAFAGERFTRDKWISAILGLMGLALIFAPSDSRLAWLALFAAILSGVATSFSLVITKQMPYNATQSSVLSWTASIIANLLMAAVFTEKMPAIGQHVQWFYLLIFAVASVIASWTFIRGLKLIDAGAAGVLGLLEIVFGLLFGILFFHEKPELIAIFGVVTIIVAAAIPYVKDYNAKRGTI